MILQRRKRFTCINKFFPVTVTILQKDAFKLSSGQPLFFCDILFPFPRLFQTSHFVDQRSGRTEPATKKLEKEFLLSQRKADSQSMIQKEIKFFDEAQRLETSASFSLHGGNSTLINLFDEQVETKFHFATEPAAVSLETDLSNV